MPKKSNFSEWDLYTLESTFALNQVDNHTLWEQWWAKANEQIIDEFENESLARLKSILIYRVDNWNEAELTAQFIGPLLNLVNFNTNQFAIFAEREIVGIIGDYELCGKPDAMVAKGRRVPSIPYFCFHEYKREFEPKGDPAGQVLVAMLVAQELNKHTMPIYGLYVAGEKWRFLLLKEKDYYISRSFTADSEALMDIFKILKALKQLILFSHHPQ